MIQKKIAKFLFSMRLMGVLTILFAAAMAVGTFIENSHSTEFARIYVYNTKWFELIILLLAVNFLGNITKYNLLRREKWPTLLFHLSFLLLIVGAGITRYISFEGVMPIREGETTNKMYSDKTYLQTFVDGETDGQMLRKKQDFSTLLAADANNQHTYSTDFKGQNVEFEITKFIKGAKRKVIDDPNGERYLKLVESSTGERRDFYVKEGDTKNINNIIVTFNKEKKGAVNIKLDDEGNYTINSPFGGDYMEMQTQDKHKFARDSTQQLHFKSLYSFAGMQMVFPEEVIRGEYDVVPDETEAKKENGMDAIVVSVKTKDSTKQVKLLGKMGELSDYKDISLGGLDFHLRYGSKEMELPFSLKLNEFIANKYPGTANNPTPSYSSFKSKVTMDDNGETSDHAIYMNHVLDHKGYRFFQMSFDPDEKGTILSVNHDWWGTNISYLGYTLLYIGLVLILFVKGSRFKALQGKLNQVKKIKKKRKAKLTGILALLFMASSFIGYSQSRKEDIPGYNDQSPAQQDTLAEARSEEPDTSESTNEGVAPAVDPDIPQSTIDSVIMANAVPERQAKDFGKLVIQDREGRMKPVNTYSSELLRKLSKSSEYKGLTSDQVLMSMTQMPTIWYNVPLIKIKKHNDSLHHVLEVNKDQNLVRLTDFFDRDGTYKLEPFLEDAYRADQKNQFQDDLTDTDMLVNLLYNALHGDLLRILPIPHDEDNKWLSYPEVLDNKFKFEGKDSLYVTNIIPMYMQSLQEGKQSNDYTKANSIVESLHSYQKKFGEEVMPSKNHINLEIIYNKFNVFEGLFWQYLLAGIFMMLFVVLEIFYEKKWIRTLVMIGKIAIIVLFAIHTLGLGARWYISGHAPWSDAYESMVYVGWATMMFGLLFGRKSDLTIASTAFVASIILMVAHWNWMDPAIANLEPVLDSYWIMIHTSIIVASYGPFTLGMILAVVTLLLMIMTNSNNKKKMKLNVKELTIITEMALTVGLVLLTIGNFLGGQWANESWGRYWNWDPKETWALISIMVYAFVLHMRLIPGLWNRFAFNWVTILAFGSIMMTYFGVNFYLSGMHSYASGDQMISLTFIGTSFGVWALLGLLAYFKFKKHFKGGNGQNQISTA